MLSKIGKLIYKIHSVYFNHVCIEYVFWKWAVCITGIESAARSSSAYSAKHYARYNPNAKEFCEYCQTKFSNLMTYSIDQVTEGKLFGYLFYQAY
jgi:hypothetical protein